MSGRIDKKPVSGDGARKPKAGVHKILQPEGWPRPKGYANGVLAEGRLIVTAGIVGWDEQGRFPDGFVDQAHQCFRNIHAILAEAGASAEHLVRLTWYVTDIDAYLANAKPLGIAYRDVFGPVFPAMATVQVARLVERAAKIEIEAMAVLPLDM
ncbi:MAG: RidA family protein [Methylobacteriaceae bacterium]|nr:RidA family protein [Methylobacteriaceae bacterium]